LGPLGGDEGIDERELVGVGGLVVEQKRGGEGFECGGVFAGDDVGVGVDAGLQGVERGGGLAFGSDGAGRFFGVQTIRADLCFGCHNGNFVGAGHAKGVPRGSFYFQLSMRARRFGWVVVCMLLRE